MSTQVKESSPSQNNMPRGAKLYFGIFMVIFYAAVGVLCILDIITFGNSSFTFAFGIILLLYSIWRAIRLFKGWN